MSDRTIIADTLRSLADDLESREVKNVSMSNKIIPIETTKDGDLFRSYRPGPRQILIVGIRWGDVPGPRDGESTTLFETIVVDAP